MDFLFLSNQISPLEASTVSTILSTGMVNQGDQLTLLATIYNPNSGLHEAAVASIIVQEGAVQEYYGPSDVIDFSLGITGTQFLVGEGTADAAARVSSYALIVSRGRLSSNAKRSTATMQLTQAYAGLMSAEAFQAAIDSYVSGVGVNDLNSNWYLNQNGGATQAVDAQIVGIRFDGIKLGDGEQAETFSETIMAMRRLVGNQLSYFYLTSDGTATGKVMSIESMDAPIEINKTLAELRQHADFPAAAGYSKATSMLLKQYNASTNRPIINATQKNA